MIDRDPDPEQTRRMHEFMRFAVDTGLVEMCLDETNEFAYYIPESPTPATIAEPSPPKRSGWHRLVAPGMLSLALVVGIGLGFAAPDSTPFRAPTTETMTGASLTSPVFTRLAERLELTCNPDREGHADCTGPTMSAEVFEHIGPDNVDFSIVSHKGTDPGDQTVVRIFTSAETANRWLGQVRRLTLYPNLVARGAIVAFGTSPTLVTRASTEAPTPRKTESRGLLAGLFNRG